MCWVRQRWSCARFRAPSTPAPPRWRPSRMSASTRCRIGASAAIPASRADPRSPSRDDPRPARWAPPLHLEFAAGYAAKAAAYQRRADDWILQHNQAANDLMSIGRQILAALIAEQVARHDYETIRQQIAYAQGTDQLLHDKFSNEDLYLWMQGEISRLYYPCYRFAFDTARQSRAHDEARTDAPRLDAQDFVQFNYWDGGRKGLLSGEALLPGRQAHGMRLPRQQQAGTRTHQSRVAAPTRSHCAAHAESRLAPALSRFPSGCSTGIARVITCGASRPFLCRSPQSSARSECQLHTVAAAQQPAHIGRPGRRRVPTARRRR